MCFIEKIETEFCEPFADVLQGFADMGYACNTTARMLDYNSTSFRRLLKRHAIEIQWPDASTRIDAYDRNPWPGYRRMLAARLARVPIYTHPETDEAMTATQWDDRLGISCTQFLRRVKQYGNQRRVFLPNMRATG